MEVTEFGCLGVPDWQSPVVRDYGSPEVRNCGGTVAADGGSIDIEGPRRLAGLNAFGRVSPAAPLLLILFVLLLKGPFVRPLV